MKRILKISLFIVLFVGTVVLLFSANSIISKQVMKNPNIELTVQDGISLLTEQEILRELYSHNLFREGMTKSELDILKIEEFLNNMNEVLSADVYVDLDSEWHVQITTRRPIARVMAGGTKSFYVDNNSELMNLSSFSKPKVLIFTGMDALIPEAVNYSEIINNDSLKTKFKLNQIYLISSYVCKDEFYSAQIVQVHYTEDDGFILIPRVGGQEIIFGEVRNEEEVRDKFQKLTTFYEEVIPYEGWNTYKIINLKFKNQIVAKKN